MTNSDLLGSIESLNALAALKLPVRTSFTVALNLRAIRDHLAVFEEERKKIADKYTKRDDSGNPVPAHEVNEKGETVLKDGKPVVMAGRVILTDPTAFSKDVEALLDVDVTDSVKIRQVKLSDMEGSIEPQHLAQVLWMINEAA